MATEQGYSNQKKKGKAQFKTIHSTGSDSFGTVMVQKALTKVTLGEIVDRVDEVYGDDGQLKYWNIKMPDAVFADVGDILRIDTPSAGDSLKYYEFEIMKVEDNLSFFVLPISPVAPQAGDVVSFYKWITTTASSTGEINVSGTIQLGAEGVVVDTNSTPLLANAVYGTASYDITNYSVIQIGVFSNVASASNGVQVQFSPDNVNWDHSHSTTYSGGSGVGYVFNAEFKYMRVRYTNGATPQTTFRIQVILKKAPVKQSLYTISQAVNGNMFAELGKNVIVGETTAGGGSFVNVKVNPSGALTVENTPAVLSPFYTELTTLNFGSVGGIGLSNAKWVRIEADSTNTVALRWKMTGLASSTSGMRLLPGGYAEIWCQGTLSITPEASATNQKVYVSYGV